jgi:hypothetical protein
MVNWVVWLKKQLTINNEPLTALFFPILRIKSCYEKTNPIASNLCFVR